ncbi:MinD/ParA family protein [Clostridium saccharobutylicum]|uniref:Flagellum site-determining protein YlxH n=1 Tax=Clostridium saccharobutylicum DSM 13864 TaxID=1345695 RepID=U5MVU9_CLOSA|nr:MinD/ParA family protein [Clostridium saccharobutylicum]AGX44879.1 flagellum site-determining protein YlxH [Clostridium saccharobutylicum DSM 13864]AQR92161.1 flagellum site-determining protein YlxH [Clostridium saccharobutylicum]AQS02063.1 flagellum site-determining protein YlxH [Clostridium saccharobutylicum]AQS11667.1 flagellum site-determining protein YlxH [Clostridium saccharobutylicum]AQS16046.1 flagellum site-determining protein YlxH [Clostridium saccharobutylicum]
MLDQAETLRQLITKEEENIKKEQENDYAKIITVTSGKGGVGKSNFVVNLAICLSNRGKKVLIFDADLGMGNDDILMGVYPKYNIFDIIGTDLKLEEIIIEASNGVSLIPAGSGLNKVQELTEAEKKMFIEKLGELGEYDYILMDTGAGVNRDVLSFVSASEELIIITTPEPTALTDAYSLMKATDHFKLKSEAKIVVNKAFTKEEGKETYDKFDKAVKRFLSMKISYLGCILDDRKLVQSVRQQKPFTMLFPNCDASKCVDEIAMKIIGQNINSTGGVRGVFKRLFNIFS